ncbi:hypothetical protein [Halolamina salifodinae]|uniref:Uncharacterized protein n=1 Tax=Halolamina salifodinae TaxID=1202767 RepID=A0A8T4GVP4_9EURY|nr:hypothetical protein [Halolamina salifodinae]MBP1986969.1 hypothetical protein [Halolamina salifodinae]
MKRRQYIGTVGSIALTPIATTTEVRASSDEEESLTVNEIKEASNAFVKRYDVGTVISVVIPDEVDALSIGVSIETNGDQFDHRYLDSAKDPTESRDDKNIWHFLHQYRDASHTVSINRRGQESIEVEKTEQNILGNPGIEFTHDTRKVADTNFATIQILPESGVQIGFDLDNDYDWLSFETYDEETGEWVEHRWEQKYIEKFDESRWVNMCGCDRPMPTVLRSRGRLKLFGVKNGEKEHIPIIRRRQR